MKIAFKALDDDKYIQSDVLMKAMNLSLGDTKNYTIPMAKEPKCIKTLTDRIKCKPEVAKEVINAYFEYRGYAGCTFESIRKKNK